jgi:hypothetical protein
MFDLVPKAYGQYKLCGECMCYKRVDRSRDEKSIHCSEHINLRNCAVQGCTFIIAACFHANTKYCTFCSRKVQVQAEQHQLNGSENNVGSATTTQRGRAKTTCQQEGCQKLAVGKIVFCAEHSRKCQYEGCSSQPEGKKTEYCLSHGYGGLCGVRVSFCRIPGCVNQVYEKSFARRTCKTHYHRTLCRDPAGCKKAAVSGGVVGRCITHGGGKRCQHDTCEKVAQGKTGFCVGHGGGKRCQVEDCTTSAQSSTGFCAKHGHGVQVV